MNLAFLLGICRPASGVITATRVLDHEQVASYVLAVSAADHGQPPNVASAVVHVAVNDLNDNSPVFSRPNQYHAAVREEQQPGEFVVLLVASDADSGENGRIVYSFESGESVAGGESSRSGCLESLRSRGRASGLIIGTEKKPLEDGEKNKLDSSTCSRVFQTCHGGSVGLSRRPEV